MDPVRNTHEAIMVGERVRELGHIPYVPHLNLLWHIVVPHEPNYWYLYDLAWLDVCDCLIRLPGESKGAEIEVARMEKLGRPVYTMEQFLGII